jgi:hypothetical protein
VRLFIGIFNTLFYSAHPDIFVIIDVLKNVQKDTYIKLRSTHLNTRRTDIIEKETFIRNSMNWLEENQIEKFEFMHSARLGKIKKERLCLLKKKLRPQNLLSVIIIS